MHEQTHRAFSTVKAFTAFSKELLDQLMRSLMNSLTELDESTGPVLSHIRQGVTRGESEHFNHTSSTEPKSSGH